MGRLLVRLHEGLHALLGQRSLTAGRLLASLVLFLAGALAAVYGLLGLLYTGEGRHPGSTYVTLAGHRYGAHSVGAVSLAVGVVLIAAGTLVRRRRPRSLGRGR